MSAEPRRDLRRSIAAALDRLEEEFGVPHPGRTLGPLDELVLTILSQSTSDRNRDAAYGALRRRYPTWEAVLRAPLTEIEKTIRVGGLSRGKSRVIRDALRRIARDQGRLSLDALKRWPLGRAREYLLGFRGVGEKTAACVLLFSCGRPAFPVDTHVGRIIRRLGWVDSRSSSEAMHALMESHVPPARHYAGHINLITLGRRICRPRNPACDRCPLRRVCRYARGAGSHGVRIVRPRLRKSMAPATRLGYSERRAAPGL